MESEPKFNRAARALNSLDTQFSVLGALILRELQARYGRDNLGFLWLIVEPFMLASVISALHYFSGQGSHDGMGPYPFTLVGYCTFIVFRNNFNRAEASLHMSNALMFHRMITPFDIMVVQNIVEFIGVNAAFFILLVVGIALGIADPPARPLYLMVGFMLMAWLVFGLSLLVAFYTYESQLLRRFVHPLSYFMIPLSGAFLTMSFLPPSARPAMAWNPLMSICELTRYGMFESAPDEYVYPLYVVAVCAALTYWGMVKIRSLRERIHVG